MSNNEEFKKEPEKDTKTLDTVEVGELFGNKNYFIPSYQRGYRWTEHEVESLLNDVNDFKAVDDKWYCLQPLVVLDDKNEKIEVVDGQQRLTTLYLILKYLGEATESPLSYETRTESKDFLTKLNKNRREENIDFHHIYRAWDTINNWFKDITEEDKVKFANKLKEKVKVIWYQPQSKNIEDSIELFTRINIGKIPLTNAELVKALFLNSSNFKGSKDQESIKLKQIEIAKKWDEIERALQDDAFWYFLTDGKKKYETRIDFLLELLMANEEGKPETPNNQYDTFNHFYSKYNNSTDPNDEKSIWKLWQKIKNLYSTLKEWFEDREVYHHVGYLVKVKGNTITTLKDLIEKNNKKTKSDFKSYLKDQISKELNGWLDTKNQNKEKGLEHIVNDLSYGDNGVRHILLLHNIRTMLEFKEDTVRFPFDRFKKEKWDVEHIHATATKPPKVEKETEKNQKDWLENLIKRTLDSEHPVNSKTAAEFITRISKLDQKNLDEEIKKILVDLVDNIQDNGLKNLCLLDKGTNRSYKDAPFVDKRSILFDLDPKKKDPSKRSLFIPVCTQKVFAKTYTAEVKDLRFWNDTDRKAYLSDIADKLSFYTNQN